MVGVEKRFQDEFNAPWRKFSEFALKPEIKDSSNTKEGQVIVKVIALSWALGVDFVGDDVACDKPEDVDTEIRTNSIEVEIPDEVVVALGVRAKLEMLV